MKTLFRIGYWPVLLDIGVILLCMLAAEFSLFVPDNKSSLVFLVNVSREAFSLLPLAENAAQTAALLSIPVHALLFYIVGVIAGSLFLPVVYFAFIKVRLRVAAEKRLVATEKDLYYFRNTFPGIKAATVSQLMDLEIDTKKDVPASLLQMVAKGQLTLDDAGFAPGAPQAALSAGEGELARLVLDGQADLTRWKALSIEEGIAAGYLQKAGRDEMKRHTRKYWATACVCWFSSMALLIIISAASDGFGFFGAVERGIEHLGLFFLTPAFTKNVLLTLLFWVVFGAFVAAMALTVYAAAYEARYKKLSAPVRRTALGEQAARRLYGIKNYIHDFTLLGEATQRQVTLWNDFLVYAVVLEENTDIVSAIGRYYPAVNLSALQKFMEKKRAPEMGIFDRMKKKKQPMTDKEFNAFVEDCYEELKAKQDILMERYNLGQYDEYWFDQPTAALQFKRAGKLELEFKVVPVGSWSASSSSWVWAWANQSVVEDLRAAALKIKGLADYTGYDVFSKEAFEADEAMAHELAAMAVHYLTAMGMYIAPAGHLKTFLALMEPNRNTP